MSDATLQAMTHPGGAPLGALRSHCSEDTEDFDHWSSCANEKTCAVAGSTAAAMLHTGRSVILRLQGLQRWCRNADRDVRSSASERACAMCVSALA